jgi:hypothetical protein
MAAKKTIKPLINLIEFKRNSQNDSLLSLSLRNIQYTSQRLNLVTIEKLHEKLES